MNSSTEKTTERTEKRSGFKQDLEFVRLIPLFQNLEYECLKLIAMLSKQINLVEGDQIITQGEDDGTAYYLIAGKLKAYHRRDDIDHLIQNFEEGQFIGGLSLLGKSIRLYNVQALQKSSVLSLHRENFQKIMKQYPQSMARIATNLAIELTNRDQKILNNISADEIEHNILRLGISLV